MHAHTTYTIYWQPAKAAENGQPGTSFTPFPGGYEATINTFLANVAADSKSHKLSNVYSTDLQYGEPTAGVYESTFGLSLKDEDEYPPRNTPLNPEEECPTSNEPGLPSTSQPCLTDSQIQTELTAFVSLHHLPTGLGAMYFVVTPQGVDSCAGGVGTAAECNTNVFCAYHFQTAALSPIVYANMPYDHVRGCETPAEPNSTPADDEISTLSHEHNEAVTDPTGAGWYFGKFVEDGDKCTYPFFNPGEDANEVTDAYGPLLEGSFGSTAFNQIINGGHYLLQREWSNATGGCVTQAPIPTASFAVYSTPTVGRSVSFNGASSSPGAGSLTSYRWDFGDGHTASGTEVTHTYEAAGEFTIKLTVTNDSGASNIVSHGLTVKEAVPGETTTVTVTTPAPPPEVVTRTITTPGPSTPTTNTAGVGPVAYTVSQLASKLGLPPNRGKLSGSHRITIGHAACPPACTVSVRLYALKHLTVHGRRVVKRVFIGALTTRVAAKGSSALTLTLNVAGRKLLRKSHTLPAQLLVSVTGREGGSWQISRTLTLTR
ncbi:MAG: PKD domain-containing protein [Solirubrobacteraceae bacterium]